MRRTKTFTLKKLLLALAIAGYTMSSAYAVLTAPTGTIQGSAPVLRAPSNSAPQAVDLISSSTAPMTTGDVITLTYDYSDADGDADASTAHVSWYYVNETTETPITTGIVNTPATSGTSGTSAMIIPAAAMEAHRIKVVIQEYSATGDPLSGNVITVEDTSVGGGGTVTPELMVQAKFILAANTHRKPYTFQAGSGFPTMGLTGASFTTTGLPSGSDSSDYTWHVRKSGGGHVSWLSVDQSGVVTFNSKPSATEKNVEVIAIPKAGGQALGYQFTLSKWFITSLIDMNRGDAIRYCQAEGYELPFIQDMVARVELGPVQMERGVIGLLYQEWGSISGYGSVGNNSTYWTAEELTSMGEIANSIYLPQGAVTFKNENETYNVKALCYINL
ncbi:TPA: hypothetical protein ACIAIE_005576 [Serratia fonticola]